MTPRNAELELLRNSPRGWLESNIETVEKAVRYVAVRRRLAAADADDLLSTVLTHLVTDDYRVLRLFRGQSSISTYLTVVVDRVLLDARTRAWGKWRPSAQARRLGERAVIFDRLVRRDGLEPAHARELVGAPLEWMSLLSRTSLKKPARPAGFVDIGAAKTYCSPAADPHAVLMEQYHAKQGIELGQQLERALCSLPVADQVLVRMRHEQGLKVSQIATMLGIDQKKLYRRLDAIHDDLRSAIKAMGVSRGDATALTASHISYLPTFFSGSRAVA